MQINSLEPFPRYSHKLMYNKNLNILISIGGKSSDNEIIEDIIVFDLD